jgi:hypothetical protein
MISGRAERGMDEDNEEERRREEEMGHLMEEG